MTYDKKCYILTLIFRSLYRLFYEKVQLMAKNDTEKKNIVKRFEAARIVINVQKEQLYSELSTSKHIYKHMLMGKKLLPFEWVKHMEERYNISPNWIYAGKGDMFISRAAI